MGKPDIIKVLDYLELKQEIKELSEILKKMGNDLLDDVPDGVYYYEIPEDALPDEEKRYCKFTVKNNVLAMRKGETVWKSAGIEMFSFGASFLKNKPKDLK